MRILTEKRLMVLRAMSTITQSTDMEEFLRMAGLSMPEALETLKELAQDGFVTKTKHGYAIVEKGKLKLVTLTMMPDEQAFHFYRAVGQPLGMSARSVKEFFDAVKEVTADSLEFHMERGDFENWIKTSVGDDVLAKELAGLKRESLNGEALRKQILLGFQGRFGEDNLQREWSS